MSGWEIAGWVVGGWVLMMLLLLALLQSNSVRTPKPPVEEDIDAWLRRVLAEDARGAA